mmetsp:Transcript_35455/g.93057  ORF Transcript_35455/g.93057 Transcript_35455/m.93057 type:complete len:326 (-) Transcript_35455:234-1211(-)
MRAPIERGYRYVAGACGGFLGILLNAKVDVNVVPESKAPLLSSLLTSRFQSISFSAVDANGLVPFSSAAITGNNVQLGWKFPAVMLIPAWVILAPRFLPLLLAMWMLLPSRPTSGVLKFDVSVRSKDMNRRIWRWLLGGVLSSIAHSSLPAMFAAANNLEPAAAQAWELPPSECLSVAVQRSKLVMEGRTTFSTAQGPLTAQYTLRTGLRPLASDARPQLRNALLWENPELRVSLGEDGLLAKLPKLWVPVLSESGVELPPAIDLRRATISDAADAVIVAGDLWLGGSRQADAAGDAAGDEQQRDRNSKWSAAERAALRLPPSES